jgi:hypothetical protein
MTMNVLKYLLLSFSLTATVFGGEKTIVSLRDFSTEELKSAGIQLSEPATLHLKALGGGGDYGWSYKSDQMFAYAWILNADTRAAVWEMTVDNTTRSRDDRAFDDNVDLPKGNYEVYFAACTFTSHSTFSHFTINIDHRRTPLFGLKKKNKLIDLLTGWWSDDIAKDWGKRSTTWGIDVLVDDSRSTTVRTFPPPKEIPHTVLKATRLGENELVRRGFTLAEPTTLHIYAIGEGRIENELVDYGWIVSLRDRKRVWEMNKTSVTEAGGDSKNLMFNGNIALDKGDYVLYFITDDSHSSLDWNVPPPYDPYNYGITISVADDKQSHFFTPFDYKEDQNIILAMVRVRDNESRTEGFTLKAESKLRIYAFGERSTARRKMADYGYIVDAKTRNKVWTMDVDRTYHAGGASKNRFVDEVITLPKGSYMVTYLTDDSHAFDDWNAAQPFDPGHYGITIMGTGERFDKSNVAQYTPQRDPNIIAQIVRVGNDADLVESFRLDRTTRVRVYALGEGEKRSMYDYGWIEDTKTGNIVWEMTYSMTFHAGGGRKNRMVNTTFLLDKGEYKLHYRSDDSHSYNRWNVDPPEDAEFWGITLYRDDGSERLPVPPVPPRIPEERE